MVKRKTKAKTQRTKRAMRKSTAGKKARKVSSPAKRKRAKRALGRAKGKGMKGAKRAQATKLINAPAIETVVVDIIEQPLPGVITVTEFEETDIRNVDLDRERED